MLCFINISQASVIWSKFKLTARLFGVLYSQFEIIMLHKKYWLTKYRISFEHVVELEIHEDKIGIPENPQQNFNVLMINCANCA